MDQVAAHVAHKRLAAHLGRKSIAAVTGHAGGPRKITGGPPSSLRFRPKAGLAIRRRVRTIRHASMGLVRYTGAAPPSVAMLFRAVGAAKNGLRAT